MTCPDGATLKQLTDGGLAPEELAALGQHLDTCLACQKTVEGLAAWRPPEPMPETPPESALLRVVDLLKQAPQEPAPLAFLGPPREPGTLGTFGPYDIRDVVGRGGMGIVFRAFEPTLRRVVAVKVLDARLAAFADHRARFLREARSAAAVRHENVAAVHAVAEYAGLPCLVMDFVEGESLQTRLDRAGPLPVDEALRLGAEVAAGLAAAHAQGVVHRDVKPGNVLTTAQGVVKVVDFGLARAADDGRLTRTGVVAGTPSYMAPEQARGETVDARADLFGLGCLLYALVAGRPPFEGETALAVLYNVCHATPTPLRELNPEVPEFLTAVVDKLLAKERDARFASAGEVEDLLRRYREHRLAPKAVAAPPTPASVAAPLPPLPPWMYGREYRSTRTFLGWPILHIASGIDPKTRKRRIARGWIAVGDIAVGGVAFGGIAVGGIAVGGGAVGLVALGGVALAALVGLGGFAVGGLALGGGAVGLIAMGGGAVGWYALGGGAWGVHPLGANVQDYEAAEFFSRFMGDWLKDLVRSR